MAYNQSRIKMFRRCQKQYSFRYDTASELGLDPTKEMVPKFKKVQLERGSWMHALQEAHHREWAGVKGPKWREVHDDFTAKYNGLFLEEREEYGDLPGETERMWKGYLRFWADDADRYSVVEFDDGPAIEFMVEQPLKKWGVSEPFKGRIDLLVEDVEYGGYWVWDHKWVSRIPDSDERMMSPQNMMYMWALRKDGIDVRGFIYNYGRTKPPTIPRVLKNGTLSMAQRMDTTYDTYVQAIKDLHGDRWKDYAKHMYLDKLRSLKERDVLWFRRERIPVEDHKIKQGLREFVVSCRDIDRRNKKIPPRTYTYSCRFGCEYHSLCTTQFAGVDIEPLIKHDYTFEDERYQDPDLMKD
jgi:hypothetical protein